METFINILLFRMYHTKILNYGIKERERRSTYDTPSYVRVHADMVNTKIGHSTLISV